MGNSLNADVVATSELGALAPRMTHEEALEAVRYMTDEDFPTAEDDELEGIIDEAEIARLIAIGPPPIGLDAQLHEHAMNAAGLMKMQQVDGVTIPAGKDLLFAPSAYHVMLMQPKDRSLLTDGKRFPLTLHFEKAGDITVQVAVQKQPPADQPEQQHAH